MSQPLGHVGEAPDDPIVDADGNVDWDKLATRVAAFNDQLNLVKLSDDSQADEIEQL